MSPPMLMFLGVLCGLFSIAGAIFNWEWFFQNNKARPFVRLFGRQGARVFYAVLGLVILAISLLLWSMGPP